MKDVTIRVVFKPHYKIHISIDDAPLLERFCEKFETVENVVYKTRSKAGQGQLRRESRIVPLWSEVDATTIQIDAGLIDYVSKWLPILVDRQIYIPHLEVTLPEVEPITLTQRWLDMLRDNQKDDIQALTQFYSGIAAQHTGYGKTLCMLAIIDCVPGKSLVLVPNNGILEEVQLRGEQFGVPIPKYDWDADVNIINPVAFLRSKMSKNKDAERWLRTVRNVFTDEAHYLKARSWGELFDEYLPRVQRAYGFSASPDSKTGTDLSPGKTFLRKMGPTNAKIVGLSGSVRIIRKSIATATMVEIRSDISSSNLAEFGKDENWQEHLTHMLRRPMLAQVVSEVFLRFPATKFYIPVHKIDAAQEFYRGLIKQGYLGVFWSSQGIIPPSPEPRDDLEYVKELMYKPEFRFLITTSLGFEGISIDCLSGVIPLFGKSYRLVMQPAGRASRGASLVYVVIFDKNNRIMMRQSQERKAWVEKEYPIEHRVKLKIE